MNVSGSFVIPAMWFFRALGLLSIMVRRKLILLRKCVFSANFFGPTYRFGTSLPQGFHHDAQFEGGRHFNQTRFDCSREGELLVTASHVNIYPNDYVRPPS